VAHTLLLHLDVLVLGWVAGPEEAGYYLIARRLAGLAGLVFEALRSAVTPACAIGFRRNRARHTGQRINRLFLIAGAATGLVLAVLAPVVLPVFGADRALWVFYLLLPGSLTPAIWGASGLMMSIGGMEEARFRMVAMVLPAGVVLLALAGGRGIAELALMASVLQWIPGIAGAVALYLRHKIRPGMLGAG
jgi:O-antigen/teichoic acid export membrane protein